MDNRFLEAQWIDLDPQTTRRSRNRTDDIAQELMVIGAKQPSAIRGTEHLDTGW